MPLQQVLSLEELSGRYGWQTVRRATLVRKCKELGMPLLKVGGRYLVREDDLDRWERAQVRVYAGMSPREAEAAAFRERQRGL